MCLWLLYTLPPTFGLVEDFTAGLEVAVEFTVVTDLQYKVHIVVVFKVIIKLEGEKQNRSAKPVE